MMLPKILQSSINPEEISLTIQSFGKSIIGIVATLAALHSGLNPQDAVNQVQLILDSAVVIVTSGYSVYHAVQAVWGAARKLLVLFATKTEQN